MISSSQRPLPDNTRHSQQTNIHAPVGFEPTISAGERPAGSFSFGIATGYGWTVRGSNPGGGGEIYRTCPDRPWGPPSLLYNGYRVFPEVKERPGRDAYPSPPSSDVGHERVELYLYSPYGSYGLYRASVPVQGCTLALPLPNYFPFHYKLRKFTARM